VALQVCLSALAWWDGSAVGGDKAGKEQLSYVAFGAGISEVSDPPALPLELLEPMCKAFT